MNSCPHGDPTCPCQDGDACHYEGWVDPETDVYTAAKPCPNPPPGWPQTLKTDDGIVLVVWEHCHLEGCKWGQDYCALTKLGVEPCLDDELPPAPSPHRICGAARAVRALHVLDIFVEDK